MQFKALYSLFFLTFFMPQLCEAGIPAVIEDYLQNNAQEIRRGLPANYAPHELILIAERIAEILIHRHKSSFDLSNKYDDLKSELTRDILTHVFPFYEQGDSASIAKNAVIQKILTDFSGDLVGDLMRIKFENLVLPLKVSASPSSVLIKILGAPLKLKVEPPLSDPKTCFWLRFDPIAAQATLEWLGTLESACPIPAKRQGEFLLSLAQALAKSMGATKIKLQDEARVLCDKDQTTANLHILRTFQNKVGFYEQSGYKPKDPQIEKIMARQRQALRALKLSELNTLILSYKSKKGISELKQAFEAQQVKFNESKEANDTVASFMSWLWQENCADYNKVYKLIFQELPLLDPQIREVVPELVLDLLAK